MVRCQETEGVAVLQVIEICARGDTPEMLDSDHVRDAEYIPEYCAGPVTSIFI